MLFKMCLLIGLFTEVLSLGQAILELGETYEDNQ